MLNLRKFGWKMVFSFVLKVLGKILLVRLNVGISMYRLRLCFLVFLFVLLKLLWVKWKRKVSCF